MKAILSSVIGLVIATAAIAKVCDQYYHFQSGTQSIIEGESATSLKPKGEVVKLNKSMNNITFLSNLTEYRLMTDFDARSTCSDYAKRMVDYAISKKGETKFTSSQIEYSLKINDSAYTFKKPGWDEYWFGIATLSGNSAILYDAIGKNKNEPLMSIWYGNATAKLTYKTVSPSGGVKVDSAFTLYYQDLQSWPDSAALVQVLLANWKKYVKSETLDVLQTVQLIKISYDSVLSPVAISTKGKQKKGSELQASQLGQIVLIQPGSTKTSIMEPLSLYGIMGNKITTLHPKGYLYQWNGKTSFGADAPAGIYFIQANNRTLGKFFYSR